MDNRKDIQAADSLSRFFDRPAMRSALALNQSVDRLYRRAERIAAALFLATNHVPQTEPLRARARERALQLLDEALLLRDEMRAPQSVHGSAFRADARYLISLLRMLTIGGFVSMQNASILIEALNELGNFLLAAQGSSLSDTVSFRRQDFIEMREEIKDIKDTSILKDTPGVKDNRNASDINRKSSLDVRKQNILEVIRGSGELGIIDIAATLPEYSSKTIQRDLNELILSGKVRRSGQKRWSRYSLA